MSEETRIQPPIISIKMVPPGVELVIAALRKLPHEQVHELVQEIAGQYGYQMQQIQTAAQQAQVEQEQVTEPVAAKKTTTKGAKRK